MLTMMVRFSIFESRVQNLLERVWVSEASETAVESFSVISMRVDFAV